MLWSQVRTLLWEPLPMKDDFTPSVIEQVDIINQQIRQAQELSEIKNAAIRQTQRNEKMQLWQDPEMMAHRHARIVQQSMESLWNLREAGMSELLTPLPPDSELPKHMRGQQPSTVRSWLRDQPEWQEKIKEFRKTEKVKRNDIRHLINKYPEISGLVNDEAARMAMEKEWGEFVPYRQPVPWLEKFKSKHDPVPPKSFVDKTVSWIKERFTK